MVVMFVVNCSILTPLQKNKFTKTKSVRVSNEHKKMVAEMATIEKRTEQCILELSIEAKYRLISNGKKDN